MVTLPPVLTLASAPGFLQTLIQSVLAEPAEAVIDASGLTDFDSSALAVLLECRRQALAAGKSFSVRGLPARLRQLAGLYGVAALIPASAQAAAPAAA